MIKGFTMDDERLKGNGGGSYWRELLNKLHYAAHGHTAAEVIYERADAQKPFKGLKVFAGAFPAAKDIGIAKNYLNEDELKIPNNLVSGYFDLAEIGAPEHRPMYMADYLAQRAPLSGCKRARNG